MWWEMLPSMGIIFGVFHIPMYGARVINRLFTDSPHGRAVGDNDWTAYWYLQRDREYGPKTFFTTLRGLGVSEGNPYKAPGLEGLPDKKPESSQ